MVATVHPLGEVVRYDGSISPLVGCLPHYHTVPKGYEENIAYRLDLYQRADRDPEAQAYLLKCCEEDFLFFLNVFCWILEPRDGEDVSGLIPFLTWCNQDPVAAALDFYFGKRHIIGDKSRAQGASWLAVANFVHKFLFRPFTILGMGSKDEDTADCVDNPESLGWKFDFLIANLPGWMQPPDIAVGQKNRKTGDHTWKNVLNGSFCKAYSATAGIGRGGRYTSFFLDESAFFPAGKDTEAVSNLLKTTNSVTMLSTPNGMNNEHYERVHTPSTWLMVILDWRDNPIHSRGKYTTKNGQLEILDLDFSEYPPDYSFILDGRIRSLWYDQKCADDNHNMLLIGQELDREYSGSKGRPFPKKSLDRALEFCNDPIHTGMLFYEHNEPELHESHKWVEGEAYKFDLWRKLDSYGMMPPGRYVVGADISAGTGGDTSSNSVLAIFDAQIREQVGELAINTIPPTEFAQLSVAICYWLGRGDADTYLAWEKNGPGTDFTNEILRLRYPNVFYQKIGDQFRSYAKTSDRPGYHTSKTAHVIAPLIRALFVGDTTVRSKPLITECGQYVFSEGKPIHPKSKSTRDDSAKGEGHGDRTIAASIAVMAMDDRPAGKSSGSSVGSKKIIADSIAGRFFRQKNSRNRMLVANCQF